MTGGDNSAIGQSSSSCKSGPVSSMSSSSCKSDPVSSIIGQSSSSCKSGPVSSINQQLSVIQKILDDQEADWEAHKKAIKQLEEQRNVLGTTGSMLGTTGSMIGTTGSSLGTSGTTSGLGTNGQRSISSAGSYGRPSSSLSSISNEASFGGHSSLGHSSLGHSSIGRSGLPGHGIIPPPPAPSSPGSLSYRSSGRNRRRTRMPVAITTFCQPNIVQLPPPHAPILRQTSDAGSVGGQSLGGHSIGSGVSALEQLTGSSGSGLGAVGSGLGASGSNQGTIGSQFLFPQPKKASSTFEVNFDEAFKERSDFDTFKEKSDFDTFKGQSDFDTFKGRSDFDPLVSDLSSAGQRSSMAAAINYTTIPGSQAPVLQPTPASTSKSQLLPGIPSLPTPQEPVVPVTGFQSSSISASSGFQPSSPGLSSGFQPSSMPSSAGLGFGNPTFGGSQHFGANQKKTDEDRYACFAEIQQLATFSSIFDDPTPSASSRTPSASSRVEEGDDDTTIGSTMANEDVFNEDVFAGFRGSASTLNDAVSESNTITDHRSDSSATIAASSPDALNASPVKVSSGIGSALGQSINQEEKGNGASANHSASAVPITPSNSHSAPSNSLSSHNVPSSVTVTASDTSTSTSKVTTTGIVSTKTPPSSLSLSVVDKLKDAATSPGTPAKGIGKSDLESTKSTKSVPVSTLENLFDSLSTDDSDGVVQSPSHKEDAEVEMYNTKKATSIGTDVIGTVGTDVIGTVGTTDRDRCGSSSSVSTSRNPFDDTEDTAVTEPITRARVTRKSSIGSQLPARVPSPSHLTGSERSHLTGSERSHLTGSERSHLTGSERSHLTGSERSHLTGSERSHLTGSERSHLTGGSFDTYPFDPFGVMMLRSTSSASLPYTHSSYHTSTVDPTLSNDRPSSSGIISDTGRPWSDALPPDGNSIRRPPEGNISHRPPEGAPPGYRQSLAQGEDANRYASIQDLRQYDPYYGYGPYGPYPPYAPPPPPGHVPSLPPGHVPPLPGHVPSLPGHVPPPQRHDYRYEYIRPYYDPYVPPPIYGYLPPHHPMDPYHRHPYYGHFPYPAMVPPRDYISSFEREEGSGRRDSFRSQGSGHSQNISDHSQNISGHSQNTSTGHRDRMKKPTDFGPSFDFDTSENIFDPGSLSPTNVSSSNVSSSGNVSKDPGHNFRVNSPNNPFSPDFEEEVAPTPPPRPPARGGTLCSSSTEAPPLPKRKSIPGQLPLSSGHSLSQPSGQPSSGQPFSGQPSSGQPSSGQSSSGNGQPSDAPPIPLPSRKKSSGQQPPPPPLDRKVSFDQSADRMKSAAGQSTDKKSAAGSKQEDAFDPFHVLTSEATSSRTGQESSSRTAQESVWSTSDATSDTKTSTPMNSTSGLDQFGSRPLLSTIHSSSEYPNLIPSGDEKSVDRLIVNSGSIESESQNPESIKNHEGIKSPEFKNPESIKNCDLVRITEMSEGDSSVFEIGDKSGFSDAFMTPPRPTSLSTASKDGAGLKDSTFVVKGKSSEDGSIKSCNQEEEEEEVEKPFNHFGSDHVSPPERNIFRSVDPFADDDFFS